MSNLQIGDSHEEVTVKTSTDSLLTEGLSNNSYYSIQLVILHFLVIQGMCIKRHNRQLQRSSYANTLASTIINRRHSSAFLFLCTRLIWQSQISFKVVALPTEDQEFTHIVIWAFWRTGVSALVTDLLQQS